MITVCRSCHSHLLCNTCFLGRTVKVQVKSIYVSFLLRVAIDVGFDWVKYESIDYVRLSVIPDGKFEYSNNNLFSLSFIASAVNLFTIEILSQPSVPAEFN